MGVIASQPAMILIFGAIGTGKTTDSGMTFPRGLFVAAPGSLKALIGVAGFEPEQVRDVPTMPEIIQLIRTARPGQYDAIVIDDLSLVVQRQVMQFEMQNVRGFDLWGGIFKLVLMLRETARSCGMHTVFTLHELPPREGPGGARLPGCPALPGNKLPYDLPAAADMVLRSSPRPAMAADTIGWPNVYRCDAADPEWRTKDRHNCTPDMAPMNLGEILRLIGQVNGVPGFAPRRLPSMEWAEPIVEKAAAKILERGIGDLKGARGILRQARDYCQDTYKADDRHALWVVRDAWDRAILRNALAAHRHKYFDL